MTRAMQLLTVCILFFMVSQTAWPQGSDTTRPIDEEERAALFPSREMLSLGENVAGRACAQCHGTDGVSIAPGTPSLAGQRTVYLYRVMQSYQDRERSNDEMAHASGFLNREVLLAVSAYYASLVPARPAMQAEDRGAVIETDSGDAFSGLRDDMKKCVRCHGGDGNASASGMPNLTAQSSEYFVTSMKAYTAADRDHKLMAKLAAKLDDDALRQMGVFYAVQEPVKTATTGDGIADAGRNIAEPCARCHGTDGNADGAEMPTLAGQDARYFVKAMQAYKSGKRHHEKMFEAVELLNETDIDDLAAFYASQEPVRRNVRAPLTTTEWIERCERCHGIDGNSNDPRFPRLAGQDRTYLGNALKAYTAGTRASTTMHAMARPLSASDVERVVEYFATREPKSVIYMQLPCEDQADP